jgi:phosphatidylinositol dimannoside acyltransferase
VTSDSRKERVAYWAYRAMAWLAKTLPERTGRRVFDALATSCHRWMPRLRGTVAANQAQVIGRSPEDPLVRASTRRAFSLYARYWQDTFLLPTMSDDEVRRRFACTGLEHFARAIEDGKGAIAVLPHMGNWDAAGRYMAVEGYPVVTVAEELRPQRLFELFLDHRTSLGMEVIGLSSNGIGRQLVSVLGSNRVLALVADRELSGRGIEVEMFGRPRLLPAGPALLALTSGAPIIPTPVYTTSDGWRCVMGPPIEVEATGDRRADATRITRRLAEEFEREIAAAPADWHLFQPGWEP